MQKAAPEKHKKLWLGVMSVMFFSLAGVPGGQYLR